MIAPAKDNICAIIVTFHPDAELPHRVAQIASQVRRVIIVDNHSDDAAIGMLRRLASDGTIQLILNDDNYGVATALNQGVREAMRQGFAWALLFDQDSVVLPSMVDVLTEVYQDYPAKDRIAVIAANYWTMPTHELAVSSRGADGRSWVERKVAISSGSLIAMSHVPLVGPFRDDLFIDEVDSEYCLRARTHGLKVLMTREPVMQHSLGAPQIRRFLWRTVRPSNHSALRWYYMTRNPIVLAKHYWRTDTAWIAGCIYDHLKMTTKVLLYEQDRLAKLRQMLRGGWHGIQGRLGKA
ncbi:MAG TPA: glycosyltransferase family 2 protein [Gemmatimonadaceae bacterium]|nr:glycosyltransferase family 2 protein [Gemmatimonadaceae bacterium]